MKVKFKVGSGKAELLEWGDDKPLPQEGETRPFNLEGLQVTFYVRSVEAVFWAFAGDVDYGQVVKFYEAEPIGPGRYSPPKVTSVERKAVFGKPLMSKVSTSHVERQNLTMRMCMHRLTRLTNGFSKKIENHVAATALHFAYYNFCRVHAMLNETPAMAAGVMFQAWTVGDLLDAALEIA